jgi:hypothetical protein
VDDIDKLNYMLTIKNISKLDGTPLVDGWDIVKVFEGVHNDTYIFKLFNPTKFMNNECTIMLERNGHILPNETTFEREKIYYFIYNSMRTNVCVSADYIADKDNMVDQLEYILMNKENL